MKKLLVALTLVISLVGACGGDSDSEDTGTDPDVRGEADDDASGSPDGGGSGDAGPSGAVVDPAPPGQATASVDGLDLTFETAGPVACSITDESITFSFTIGDNEVTLAAGVNEVDGGWMGSIALDVANPTNEDGPIAYYIAPGANGIVDASLFAVDGDSMSYSGPMLKQPANDGSNPPPVEVGDGTISATCG